MKNIILGVLLALFGGSILWGNVTHSSYGFMTVVGMLFTGVGVYGVIRGFRERGQAASKPVAKS